VAILSKKLLTKETANITFEDGHDAMFKIQGERLSLVEPPSRGNTQLSWKPEKQVSGMFNMIMDWGRSSYLPCLI
jgi:hypothetical protein